MKPAHAAAGLALCLLLALAQGRMVVVEGDQPDDGYSLYFSSSADSAGTEERGQEEEPGFWEDPVLRNPVDWLVESMEAVEALNRAMLVGSMLEQAQAEAEAADTAESKLQRVANSRFRGAVLDYQQSQRHSESAQQTRQYVAGAAASDGQLNASALEHYESEGYYYANEDAYMDSAYEPQDFTAEEAEGLSSEEFDKLGPKERENYFASMGINVAGPQEESSMAHVYKSDEEWKKENDDAWEEFVDKYDEAEWDEVRARLEQDIWSSLSSSSFDGDFDGFELEGGADGEVEKMELEKQRLQELYLQQAVEDSYWRQQADMLDMLRSFIVLIVGPAQPEPPVVFLFPQPQQQQVSSYYDQLSYAYGEYYEPYGRAATPGWGGVGEPDLYGYYSDEFVDEREVRSRPVMDWRLVDDRGSVNWGVAMLLVLVFATAAVAVALICSFTQLRQAMAGVGGPCCFGGADPELGSDGVIVPVEFEGADGKTHVGYMLVPPGACVMGKAGPELPKMGKATKPPKHVPVAELQPVEPVVVAADEVVGANELRTPLLAGVMPSDDERASR